MKIAGLWVDFRLNIQQLVLIFIFIVSPWQLYGTVETGDLSSMGPNLNAQKSELYQLQAWFYPLVKRLEAAHLLQSTISSQLKEKNHPQAYLAKNIQALVRSRQQATQMAGSPQAGEVDWAGVQNHIAQALTAIKKSQEETVRQQLSKALVSSSLAEDEIKKALDLLKKDQKQKKDSQDKKKSSSDSKKQDKNDPKDQPKKQEGEPQEPKKEPSPQQKEAQKAEEQLKAIDQKQEMEKKRRKKQLGVPRHKPVLPVERDW